MLTCHSLGCSKSFFFSLDFIKMGDLATEIEQMEQDINAFDDELDALEQ